MRVMRALVSGCAGFVGSELTRQLLAAGYAVTGLDNVSRGTESHMADFVAHPAFRFVRGDVRSADDVAAAFAGKPGFVFHLAARHFIPECVADPAGTYDINVVGTQRVWEAAKVAGVRRFLLVSTGDVYKPAREPHRETDVVEPFNAYGLSKWMAEQALRLDGGTGVPRRVVVRLFNVYGPGETNPHLLPAVIAQVRAGVRRLELGNLWPVRDYVFVRDVAAAFRRLLEADEPPDVVNVGTGGGWTVEQLVAALAEATGLVLEAVSIPEKCRAVERDVLRPDVTRLSASVGRPTTSLLDGLRETFTAAGV